MGGHNFIWRCFAPNTVGRKLSSRVSYCEIANFPAAAPAGNRISPLTAAKENCMEITAKRILVAAALMAAAPLALPAVVASPAYAQVGITFDLGNVGYGYRDGYVDRDRRYYRWRNAEDARLYRSRYNDYYMYENYDRNRHHQTYRGR